MISGKKNKQNRGFNLIEIAIVLAVVGIIVGGIYVAASSVYENNRKQEVQKQLLTIVQNMRAVYAGQVSIGTFATADAVAARIIPQDMINGSAAVNAYGGATTVANSGSTGFTVTMEDVSRGACTEMLMKTVSTAQIADALGVTGATAGSAVAIGATIATITARCDNTDNDVAITFSLRG